MSIVIARRGSMAVTRSNVITDTFTAADGTNINGRTTETGGKTWSVVNGTLDINTNKARVTAGSGSSVPVIDLGSGDFDMSFSVTIGHANIDGAIFRLTDTSNYLRIALNTSGPFLNLIHCIAGSETTVTSGSTTGVSIGSTGTLRVRCVGSSVKAWWNGSLVIDTTDSTHSTVTKHGMIGFSTSTRFDDVSLVAV